MIVTPGDAGRGHGWPGLQLDQGANLRVLDDVALLREPADARSQVEETDLEEGERLGGENIRRIRLKTERVRGVRGEEQSLWGGSDEKGRGEVLGTFSPLVLFRLNLPTRSVPLPAPPNLLCILLHLADGIRAEWRIMGRRVADRGRWEGVESR